ncbi:MAG: type II secretion system F family protein [Fimbriimonas sp.]|nr:type II secretion system F family protein [Fimbriimonas sp.]
MPFMRFEAKDPTGRVVSGTLQAASAKELESLLAKQNLSLVTLNGWQIEPVAAPTKSRTPVPIPARQAQTQAKISTPTPSRQVSDPPCMAMGRYFLLFTRWADLSRAGVGQASILNTLAGGSVGNASGMFREMAEETSNGSMLADSMEIRPRYFAPNVASTIRVGEIAGTVPEAMLAIAETAKRAWAFAYFQFAYGLLVVPGLIVASMSGWALGLASKEATRAHFNETAKQLGNETPSEFGRRILMEKLHDHWGLFIGGFIVSGIYIALYLLLMTPTFRQFRHRLGTWVPFALPRARSEAVERVAWALSSLLKAGLSPAAAIYNALGTIPNLHLRAQALRALGNIRENEPLTSILPRLGLLERQQIDMIHVGEQVGTPDRSMEQIVEMERIQYGARTRVAQIANYIGLALGLGLVIGGVVIGLYTMYATNMVDMLNHASDVP